MGRGSQAVDHRPWIKGRGAILVQLGHGTCELGVCSDREWAGARWRLYLRFCTNLGSSAELGAYCWEGWRPVAAWFLVAILSVLLGWGRVAACGPSMVIHLST